MEAAAAKGKIEIDERTSNPVVNVALDTVRIGKQALVFVSTRQSAEKSAEEIAHHLKLNNETQVEHGSTGPSRLLATRELTAVSEEALHALSRPTRQCERLARCIKGGAAFHHSGLTAKQRQLIEDNFRSGMIKIICCTPTLAAGVDLPAFRAVIRDLKRFSERGGYGYGGSNWIPVLEYLQMCLPYAERVITDKGALPIGEIVEGKLPCKVLSFNTVNANLEFKPIEKYFKLTAKKLIELSTREGYRIRLTEDHPVLSGGTWKPAKEMDVGDEILFTSCKTDVGTVPSFFEFIPDANIYVKGLGHLINDAKRKLRVTDKSLAKILGVKYELMYHYKKNLKNVPYKCTLKVLKILNKNRTWIKKVKTRYGSFLNIPERIDKDLLWVAGVIATDGNIQRTLDKRTGSEYIKIRVFNKNNRIINKSKRILERLISGKTCVRKGNEGGYACEIGGTLLAHILKRYFGIPFKNKTTEVDIPPFLLSAPLSLVGAYLGGVFDGDGSYTVTKNKKFNTTLNHRVLFVSGSIKFAAGIQNLLLRLGIVSKFYVDNRKLKTRLRGKIVEFNKPKYYVFFNSKKYVQLFGKYASPVKSKIRVQYSSYHNLDNYYRSKEECHKLKIAEKRVVILPKETNVYNIKVQSNENYFAANFLVHNCGRAGRPRFDSEGQAVIVAGTESEEEEVTERYIHGQPEDILSKLAVEPVLRTYLLSLISTGIVGNRKEVMGFFSRTFWSHQYKDFRQLEKILDKMLFLLEEWEFINRSGNAQDFTSAAEIKSENVKPTLLGTRVAQLYLDPLTAHEIIIGLRKATAKKVAEPAPFQLLQLISSTLEMRPLLKVKVRELEDFQAVLAEQGVLLLAEEPSMFEDGYDDFLASVKTAKFFEEWIDEQDEEYLLEKYGIRPGEVHAKLGNADWLLYSASEIAKLMQLQQLLKHITKLRFRVEHGVKEELLPLLQLRGIGRVRARKLFSNRIKSLADVKSADVSTLTQILGSGKIAVDIKQQLGEKTVAVKEGKRKGQINLKDYGEN